MTNKYLVTNLKEREKKIIHMKSILSNMSIDEFVLNAVDEKKMKPSVMDCPRCKVKMKVTTASFDYKVTVASQESDIKIVNYPRNKCPKCTSEIQPFGITEILDDLIFHEVMKKVNRRKPVPNRLDFNVLIKM